jgi:small subunit ribosomal protein S6
MRDYEAVFIFQPEEEPFTEGNRFVRGEFEKAGIQFQKEEDMGTRNLAYQIKKNNQGRYLYFEFQALPDQLSALDRSFRLKSEILKYLVVRKET